MAPGEYNHFIIEMEEQICPACKAAVGVALPENCPHCDYPFAGTKKEQGRFIGKRMSMNNLAATTKKVLLAVRIILLVQVAGLCFLLFMKPSDTPTMVFNGLLGVTFLVALLLSFKKPVFSIWLALVVYVLILIAEALSGIAMHGIIFKLAILGIMVYSLYNMGKLKRYFGVYPPVQGKYA